jgi:hypothetical protein
MMKKTILNLFLKDLPQQNQLLKESKIILNFLIKILSSSSSNNNNIRLIKLKYLDQGLKLQQKKVGYERKIIIAFFSI